MLPLSTSAQLQGCLGTELSEKKGLMHKVHLDNSQSAPSILLLQEQNRNPPVLEKIGSPSF